VVPMSCSASDFVVRIDRINSGWNHWSREVCSIKCARNNDLAESICHSHITSYLEWSRIALHRRHWTSFVAWHPSWHGTPDKRTSRHVVLGHTATRTHRRPQTNIRCLIRKVSASAMQLVRSYCTHKLPWCSWWKHARASEHGSADSDVHLTSALDVATSLEVGPQLNVHHSSS
jgi:hypothetical protein